MDATFFWTSATSASFFFAAVPATGSPHELEIGGRSVRGRGPPSGKAGHSIGDRKTSKGRPARAIDARRAPLPSSTPAFVAGVDQGFTQAVIVLLTRATSNLPRPPSNVAKAIEIGNPA